jgi:hypothetical protein
MFTTAARIAPELLAFIGKISRVAVEVLLQLGENQVALKTAHSTYVSAKNEKDEWRLRADADRILGWEIFLLQPYCAKGAQWRAELSQKPDRSFPRWCTRWSAREHYS